MTKQLLTNIMVLLCFSSAIVAQNNDHERELADAKVFLSTKGVDTSNVELDVAPLKEAKEVILFYNNDMFVLTAVKDYYKYLSSPILAYSLEGGFYKEDFVNEKIFLLQDYTTQLQYLKEKRDSSSSFVVSEDTQSQEFVFPLLGVMKWGTDYPFNIFCPVSASSPNVRTKASSSGVAMAQIMKYHKHPTVGRGQFHYEAGTDISLNFNDFMYDWTSMFNTYNFSITTEEVSAVAKLIISTCGAVGTRFECDKSYSGTDDIVRKGFVNHFKYSPQCTVIETPTAEEVLKHAYHELSESRPFIVTIDFEEYGHHSLVCDGHDGNFLHFNTGMYGLANGYYRILTNEASSFLFYSLITNIKPDKDNLMTKEIVINNAGTLSQLLSEEEKENVRSLKIEGSLNNEDIKLIRQMAGAMEENSELLHTGNLMELDLSEAEFVTDAQSYYMTDSLHYTSIDDGFFTRGKYIFFHTQEGLISPNMFKDCINLQKVILPKNTKCIENYAFSGCLLLEGIEYDPKNTEIKNNILYNTISYNPSTKKKILYPLHDFNSKLAEQPEFPGGMAELMKCLQENIKYPEVCQEQGIQGRVIVQFVVDSDGSIIDPKVVKPVNPFLDTEALRVVSTMPKWRPGTIRGKPTRVQYTLPITFRLSN